MKKSNSIIGILVSAALIIGMCWTLDLSAVWSELLQFNYWAIVPAALATAIHVLIRAYRWQYFLPNGNATRYSSLLSALLVGNLSSYILPLRAGEFIRPYLLSKSSEHSFSTTFASIVIERFFDLSVVLLSLGVVMQFLPNLPPWIASGAYGFAMMAGGILFFLSIGIIAPSLPLKCAEPFLRLLPLKLGDVARLFLHDLLAAVAVLRSVKNLVIIVVLSGIVWLSCFLLFHSLLWLSPEFPKGFSAAVTITTFVALAIAAPSAPGFLGVFQAGCVAAFAIFGISKELAVAYAVVAHIFHYVYIIFAGGLALGCTGIHLGDLQGIMRRKREFA